MIFLDTNIWNYAILSQNESKRTRAREIISRALAEDNFVISTQVMSECANIMQKKGHLTSAEMLKILHYMGHVKKIVQVTPQIVIRGIELQGLYCLSLYDSQIIAAAEDADCTEIWTEDLQDNALYVGIRCVDPFR